MWQWRPQRLDGSAPRTHPLRLTRPVSTFAMGWRSKPQLSFAARSCAWRGCRYRSPPGLRLSVPIISDGPLKKLNNSLALGVGVNWAIFKESCGTYFWDGPAPEPDEPQYPTYAKGCTAHQITAPVVIQWNFWITEVVSVFAEPGMAFLYERRSGTGWCDGEPCSKKDSTTKLPFVMWGGARMAMSESLALTIRLGTPYVSAGASLFF